MKKEIIDATRIPLCNLNNTRDLGGYCSVDGRHIKLHKLIRSGTLSGASTEDLEILRSYGVRTVVDFRSSEEKRLKPDPELAGVAYMEIPILEEVTLGITREGEENAAKNELLRKAISIVHTSGSIPIDYMKNLYKKLILNSFCQGQYRKFFDVLLSQEKGAVLWHCTAGKDRVGVATILVLAALSVSREQIITDYQKVNEFNREKMNCLMEILQGETGSSAEEKREKQEAARLLFMVERVYAEAVFEAMEQESGSVDAFLERKMGLTERKRRLLKNKYLNSRERK